MKVLVIDDECLVRDSVLDILRGIGLTDLYLADDGIEGLSQIQVHEPDLIIADIRMPGLDGIELLAKLRQLNNHTPFVLLSGYDLFEYAQTAVNLGAASYLLKPVSPQQLQGIVLKVQHELLQKNRSLESRLWMNIKWNQGLMFMKRSFIGEIVTQKCPAENYLHNRMKELEIGFVHDLFYVVCISLDHYSNLADELSSNEIALIKYGLENIACEILDNRAVSAYPFDTEDGQGLLINLPAENTAYASSLLTEACLEIQAGIHRFLRQRVTIGIGTPARKLSHASRSYETSKQALMQRLVKGTGSVIHYEPAEQQLEKFKAISFQTEQDMLAAFEKGDQETALRIIQELYAPFIVFEYVDKASLLKLNFQLILLLFKILERFEVAPMDLLGEELTLYEEVNQCNHIDAILDWFQDKLAIGFHAMLQNREKGTRKLVERARGFIHEHYMEDLSLETVAAHIHVSPAYFSSIFKKETNENFVDYVSHYRIEKAKQLLRSGGYKVNTVAELTGFHNMKYFYKVFKKLTGLTPSEYKDL
ncbi:MAG: response regulator [Paenibacillaceae bacterium]|jgi:two-component system response regulator YesN|nr:response regulator [Paenibacillaceae bacterium]